MHRLQTAVPVPWLVALGAASGLWLLAASPSWLSLGGGYGVREAFSLVCHQLTERSPNVHGAQWALCFRCTGVLGGVVLGLASGPWLGPVLARVAAAWGGGRLLLLMGLPTAFDWFLSVFGPWVNTPFSRVTTGALLGLGAGLLLANTFFSRPLSTLSTLPST